MLTPLDDASSDLKDLECNTVKPGDWYKASRHPSKITRDYCEKMSFKFEFKGLNRDRLSVTTRKIILDNECIEGSAVSGLL